MIGDTVAAQRGDSSPLIKPLNGSTATSTCVSHTCAGARRTVSPPKNASGRIYAASRSLAFATSTTISQKRSAGYGISKPYVRAPR